jgi:hypothetical protein
MSAESSNLGRACWARHGSTVAAGPVAAVKIVWLVGSRSVFYQIGFTFYPAEQCVFSAVDALKLLEI